MDTADPKLSPTPSQTHLLPNGTEGSENDPAVGLIPHICISFSKKEEANVGKLLDNMKLPLLDEVLQDLGHTKRMCLKEKTNGFKAYELHLVCFLILCCFV